GIVRANGKGVNRCFPGGAWKSGCECAEPVPSLPDGSNQRGPSMAEPTTRKLAVLIDADNISASKCGVLVNEIAKYGLATVKQAYGDWTTPQLAPWKDVLHEYAVTPVQQFGYSKGKNSTDSAMIIDAMDLLYTGKFDGFCLVTSDSDFTPLATRIRKA